MFVANVRMQGPDNGTDDEQYHPTANDTFMDGNMFSETNFNKGTQRYSSYRDLVLETVGLLQMYKLRHLTGLHIC